MLCVCECEYEFRQVSERYLKLILCYGLVDGEGGLDVEEEQ